MKYLGVLSLVIFTLANILFAEEKKQEKEPEKVKKLKEFFDPLTERPPFHMMSGFQNGYLTLSPFSIPIFRNGGVVCKVEIEIVIQSENVQSSLTLYRQRRILQDKLYVHLYQIFDFAWRENWHPEIDPIRKNILKELQKDDAGKIIKNVLIKSFLIKNS